LGLEELIGRLERDAAARIATIEAEAQAEVDAVEASAARAASRISEEALAARRAERRVRLDRELSEARHTARADRLRAEHALLARVMDRASALLLGDDIDRGEALTWALPARVAEALRFVEGRAARVRCRPALAPSIRSATAGRAGVAVEEVPSMAPGFSVVAEDGSLEVDDTLPSRLRRLRPRLLIELLAEVER
jgi:vacuolar-type H+-ATPase subunit E/Vma4